LGSGWGQPNRTEPKRTEPKNGVRLRLCLTGKDRFLLTGKRGFLLPAKSSIPWPTSNPALPSTTPSCTRCVSCPSAGDAFWVGKLDSLPKLEKALPTVMEQAAREGYAWRPPPPVRTPDPNCAECGGDGIDHRMPFHECACVRFVRPDGSPASLYDYMEAKGNPGLKLMDGEQAAAARRVGLREGAAAERAAAPDATGSRAEGTMA
jgi:hypothetical protein